MRNWLREEWVSSKQHVHEHEYNQHPAHKAYRSGLLVRPRSFRLCMIQLAEGAQVRIGTEPDVRAELRVGTQNRAIPMTVAIWDSNRRRFPLRCFPGRSRCVVPGLPLETRQHCLVPSPDLRRTDTAHIREPSIRRKRRSEQRARCNAAALDFPEHPVLRFKIAMAGPTKNRGVRGQVRTGE